MNKFTQKYKITLDGNDLDVKAMQKLKNGDLLKLARVSDGEDTFEITVSTSADKMLDMLDYCDSVGVAPFIDDGSVVIENATVDKVFIKQGKSRAKAVLSQSIRHPGGVSSHKSLQSMGKHIKPRIRHNGRWKRFQQRII